jgi:hypothetical protein
LVLTYITYLNIWGILSRTFSSLSTMIDKPIPIINKLMLAEEENDQGQSNIYQLLKP